MLRYAFFCPLSLAIFIFSFSPLFKKLIQTVIALWEVVGGSGIIVMVLLAPPPVNFSYYAGLILVFMMAYTVVKQRFIWAAAAGWFLVMLYELTAMPYC